MAAPLSRFRQRVTPNREKGYKDISSFVAGKYNTYVNGILQSSVDRHLTGAGPSTMYEKTWDQNNRESSDKKGRRGSRVFRTGGPFVSVKVNSASLVGRGFGTFSRTSGNTKREYVGGFYNPVTNHDPVEYSDLYLNGGPAVLSHNKLIADTADLESRAFDIKPKVERVSALNALYEFKDVPAQLRQAAKAFNHAYAVAVDLSPRYRKENLKQLYMPQPVAEHFLSAEFGWIPFCQDIANMCDYLLFSKQYLDDITAGNDTWIKRKGTLVDVVTNSKIGSGLSFGCEPQGSDMNQLCDIKSSGPDFYFGDYEVYSEERTLAWAEGSFKYYRPEFDDKLPYYGSLVASVNRHLTASGLRLTPYHVWKAIPWSWCIDWFSNVGRIIEHADAQFLDSIVTKYLYIMHHKMRKITSYHRLYFTSGAKIVTFERFVDVKQRRSADSPYGFVLGGDLSATQWSILAALGLSRNVSFARSF